MQDCCKSAGLSTSLETKWRKGESVNIWSGFLSTLTGKPNQGNMISVILCLFRYASFSGSHFVSQSRIVLALSRVISQRQSATGSARNARICYKMLETSKEMLEKSGNAKILKTIDSIWVFSGGVCCVWIMISRLIQSNPFCGPAPFTRRG